MAQATTSRVIAGIGHFSGVNRVKKSGLQQVTVYFDDIFGASKVNKISEKFGWKVSGASADHNMIWFTKE